MNRLLRALVAVCGICFCSNQAMDGQSHYAVGMLVCKSAGVYTQEDTLKINQLVLVKCEDGFKVGRIDACHGDFFEVTTYIKLLDERRRGGSLLAKGSLFKLPTE